MWSTGSLIHAMLTISCNLSGASFDIFLLSLLVNHREIAAEIWLQLANPGIFFFTDYTNTS